MKSHAKFLLKKLTSAITVMLIVTSLVPASLLLSPAKIVSADAGLAAAINMFYNPITGQLTTFGNWSWTNSACPPSNPDKYVGIAIFVNGATPNTLISNSNVLDSQVHLVTEDPCSSPANVIPTGSWSDSSHDKITNPVLASVPSSVCVVAYDIKKDKKTGDFVASGNHSLIPAGTNHNGDNSYNINKPDQYLAGACVTPTVLPTLTVTKVVINDNGGTKNVIDFPLFVNENTITSDAVNIVTPGTYTISETESFGYEATFSGDCDEEGNITLDAGENKTCIITNDDISPKLTINKTVINDDETGSSSADDFSLFAGITSFINGVQASIDAGSYFITEDGTEGYTASFDGDCEGGSVTLLPGEEKICEIVNNDNPVIPILGCTDPTAKNYDESATENDGSCEYPVLGCTDPAAINYNPLADEGNIEAGDCEYPVLGCTDEGALNYNPLATLGNEDAEECSYPVLGCTDPDAINYNPLATPENDEFAECEYEEVVLGCTDQDATNYNPLATIGNPNADDCEFPEIILGCTDPAAINYNPLATEDNVDATDCIYPTSFACSDDADNDEDNFTDALDPGCHSDGDANNPDSYVPEDDDETNTPTETDVCPNIDGVQTSTPNGKHKNNNGNCVNNTSGGGGGGSVGGFAQCADNKDNDGDNLEDTLDPGCHSDGDANNPNSYVKSDNDETNGEVLGAETSCGIYLEQYLKMGRKNDSAAVKKVQKFLNDFFKAGLKEDGIFGPLTDKQVKSFQWSHKVKILDPWKLKAPTGIVYLTTQTEINNIMCPILNLPIPTNLIPFESNPAFPKVK